MPRIQYTRSPYRLSSPALGHIEGLTLSLRSNSSRNSTLLHYFGGLPYALPPIGPYRFRRPRPLPEYFRYGTRANPGRFTRGTAVCPQPSWSAGNNDDEGEGEKRWWDKDCLQLNVYVPAGEKPRDGWPVFFYIHGGFLQWGNANMTPEAVAPLLGETALKAIIVQPAYRLNAFGFLASKELQADAQQHGEVCVGNMGFWDQRLALEWTAKYIRCFGGNPSNITVGGYSAGSHSTFQQLAHELYFVPDEKAVIKRAIMWSNSPGVQPKVLAEQQKQFDEYLNALGIPLTLSAKEKLQRLRAIPAKTLVDAQAELQLSQFRATTDDSFISSSMVAHINSGDFARRMKSRGIKLLNGECRQEHNLYRSWKTPAATYQAVYTRLCADYPEKAVAKLMKFYCGSNHALPVGMQDWHEAFGRLYANMQVHCLERGFQNALVRGGLQPGKDLLRYRIEWRAQCVELPTEWGVTHATDMAIWFWGEGKGEGLTDEEKALLRPWNKAFGQFVQDGNVAWPATKPTEALRLSSEGKTDVWVDDRWEEGLQLWDQVNGVAGTGLLAWMRSKL